MRAAISEIDLSPSSASTAQPATTATDGPGIRSKPPTVVIFTLNQDITLSRCPDLEGSGAVREIAPFPSWWPKKLARDRCPRDGARSPWLGAAPYVSDAYGQTKKVTESVVGLIEALMPLVSSLSAMFV